MRTVILGGGFGGVTVARELRRLVPDCEIVLIDRSPGFIVGATKTWVMVGQAASADVVRDRAEMLPEDVRWMRAEVTAIAPRERRVTTTDGEITADFLVIALGAALNMRAIPGLAESAHTFYTLEGAQRLRELLRQFRGGRVVILIPRIPFQCPPAPYEAAMLLDDFFKRRGIRDETTLSVYTIETAPMATAGPEMGQFIKNRLVQRDIGYYSLHKTVAVDPQRRVARFDTGAEAEYELLIAVPPHEAPQVIRDAGLLGESGWIPVDPSTLRVKNLDGRVYAIGDVAGIPLPGRYKPDMPLSLPKAGTMAEAQGIAVASQIASQIDGGAAESFKGQGFCFLELGQKLAMKAEGDFFAQPHPVMKPKEPDEGQHGMKRDWVAGWLGKTVSY